MKKANIIIKEFFKDIFPEEMDESFSNVVNIWKEICGIDLASHSEIIDIKNNSLIIAVDHPGWKQIINFKKKYILTKINKKFPELKINKLAIQMINTKIEVKKTTLEKTENLDFKNLLNKLKKDN